MLGHNGRSTSIISVLTKDLTNLPEELLETTRCCSDRVFYNILLTFLDLGGTPGDSSMLLRACILQYIINFSRSRRSSWRQLDVAQTVYFTIHYLLSWLAEELLETARCCSDRVFYNILLSFPGLEHACRKQYNPYMFIEFRQKQLIDTAYFPRIFYNMVKTKEMCLH